MRPLCHARLQPRVLAALAGEEAAQQTGDAGGGLSSSMGSLTVPLLLTSVRSGRSEGYVGRSNLLL